MHLTTTSTYNYLQGAYSTPSILSSQESYQCIYIAPASYGFARKENQDDGIRYVYFLPGCSKDAVSVTYVEQDNEFSVKANDNTNVKNYSDKVVVSPRYDVSRLNCFLKNGLLSVEIPLKKQFEPVSAKII
jgi:HSP20 family molecular chaperone IbpA